MAWQSGVLQTGLSACTDDESRRLEKEEKVFLNGFTPRSLVPVVISVPWKITEHLEKMGRERG